LPASLAEIAHALRGGDVAVNARIADSVRRPYGVVYRVVVSVACGGFGFDLVDEVGKHISDFDLYDPNFEIRDALAAGPNDAEAAELFRLGDGLHEDANSKVALAIVTANRAKIRAAIVKLVPALASQVY